MASLSLWRSRLLHINYSEDTILWEVIKVWVHATSTYPIWLFVPNPRSSNQSIIKEISPGYSLEGLMLKLKLQYFDHLMRRTDSLEKTLMLGGPGDRRRRRWHRMRWLDGITNSMDMAWVDSGSWWWTGRPGVLRFMGSQRVGHDWATGLNWTEPIKHRWKKVKVKVAELCLTLCDPWVDYTDHGILQARILEWVAVPFSRGSSKPSDQTQVIVAGGFFTSWATREAQ